MMKFVSLCCLLVAVVFAEIPFDKEQQGDFTFYDAVGNSACGPPIDAVNQELVAVSKDWFTSGNPNHDELCSGKVCVKVDANGKSVKVPVKDKCMGCNKGHLDLSKPAFQKLADLGAGHVFGIKWKFVHC